MQRKIEAEEGAARRAEEEARQALIDEIAAEKVRAKELAKRKAHRRQQALEKATQAMHQSGKGGDSPKADPTTSSGDRMSTRDLTGGEDGVGVGVGVGDEDDDDFSVDSAERDIINQATELATMREMEIQQRLIEQRRKETVRMEHEDIFSFMRETHDKREKVRKIQRRQELEDFYRPPLQGTGMHLMNKNGTQPLRAVLPDLILRPTPAPLADKAINAQKILALAQSAASQAKASRARDLLAVRPKNQFSLNSEQQVGGTLVSEYPFLSDLQDNTGYAPVAAAAAATTNMATISQPLGTGQNKITTNNATTNNPLRKTFPKGAAAGTAAPPLGETIYSLPAVGGPSMASYAQQTTSAVYNTKMTSTFVRALGLKSDHKALAREALQVQAMISQQRKIPLRRQLIASASEPAIRAAAETAGAMKSAWVDSRPGLAGVKAYNPFPQPSDAEEGGGDGDHPHKDDSSRALSSLPLSAVDYEDMQGGRRVEGGARGGEDIDGLALTTPRTMLGEQEGQRLAQGQGLGLTSDADVDPEPATMVVLSEYDLEHDWAMDDDYHGGDDEGGNNGDEYGDDNGDGGGEEVMALRPITGDGQTPAPAPGLTDEYYHNDDAGNPLQPLPSGVQGQTLPSTHPHRDFTPPQLYRPLQQAHLTHKMDDKHMNLEAMHRIRTVMNVAQGNALTSFVRNNQTKEGGANGRTASLDTPLIPVTMTTAEKISAILQKNRLDLVQTQKSLALASMSAVDPSTILDAKRFSKHPQGLTHVKRQQTDIAQKAGAVVRTALPPATLLFGAGERFGMGDKATVAVREGVTDLLAQRERHKDLLVLLEEQGGAIGDGKGMDRRGLIGLSQVSGLEVLPGLQQQQQQGKTSTMMKMDDDDIGLGLGLGGVNAGGQGLSYSPP